MKKSIEIVGLPIVSITEGRELGIAKSILIDPNARTAAALLVDDGKWYWGAKFLPFTSITGLGESAIIVESCNSLQNVESVPELEKLLEDEVKIIGTKVLTRTGRIQGKVTEIIIDIGGKIVACEIEESTGNLTNLPAQQVITFGKDVLIMTDNGDEVVDVKPVLAAVPTPVAVPVATPAAETSKAVVAEKEEAEKTVAVEASEAPADLEKSPPAAEEGGKKFDDKHRKYLLGKKASRKIETDNGMLIVDQGGEITEEVLQKAKLAGKFVELSMNIQ
ncbi:PRC-barrel domain-containing protein [Azotosporobacter soli]|uniref:PRC-barrel domain-containing protein n=1 Tax=Azotosporobacter soli TaxID=3055040 RepID=UPI0031FED8A2